MYPTSESKSSKVRNTLLEEAENHAQFCTMAYQLYANVLGFVNDPFYKRHGDSKQIQKMLKEQARLLGQPMEKELDYISYEEDYSGVDLRKPTFYTGSAYFEPPDFAKQIGRIFYGDELVKKYNDKSGQDDSIDIYMFKGTTGESIEHRGSPSTMGYVAYNRKTKEITVAFRGSRSGSAIKGAIGGLFFEEGNPDWVTDMNLAGDLVENREILVKGKVANGFATTYLSCRSDLIEIIKKIRKSDPHPSSPPKLVTTGHSLGGALATMMFIDAKKGTLAQRLKNAIGGSTADDVFVDNLFGEARCFAFSAPPVCDGNAVKILSNQRHYVRVFFENDPIVFGGNVLRILLLGRDLLTHKELLRNIKGHDINLGKFSGGSFGDPHELYLVYEQIQKSLGIAPDEIRRYWYKIEDMMIIHGSKNAKPKPISAKQAAIILGQFNYEYFLTLVRVMAELESRETGKTELIEYIEKIGSFFHNTNPYENEEKFKEFKEGLGKIVKELEGGIANEEKSWARYPRKVGAVIASLLKIILMVVNLVLEFTKGLFRWFVGKGAKAQTVNKELGNSIRELDALCKRLMNEVVLPLSEHLEEVGKDPAKLENLQERISLYEGSILQGLSQLQEKIDSFQSHAKKDNGIENKEILKFSQELAEKFDTCIKACQSSWSEKDVEQYDLKYQELSEATYALIKTFADFESRVVKRNERWNIPEYKTSFAERAANMFMFGSGLIFGLNIGLAKLIKSVLNFGRACRNLFTSARTTKNYMQTMFGIVSEAVNKTDFKALQSVYAARAKIAEPQQPKVELHHGALI